MMKRLLLLLLLALVLTLIPLPLWLESFRPPWVLLFILSVLWYYPRYFSITGVFLLGLCLDVLLSTLLGEHAVALLLTTAFATHKSKRLHYIGIGQQMVWVGVFCFLYQLTLALVDGFLGYGHDLWNGITSALTSVLFWPWVKLLIEVSPMRQRARS